MLKTSLITGLFDLVQAHVRVLNDHFPERTLSETIATAQLYWDGTNELRLQLKMIRPTAMKVAYATQDQPTMMERPFSPVRTSLLPRAAAPRANRADICYSCNKPGLFAAEFVESYRPRERRRPPVGVHAITNGDTKDDATEDPTEDINASQNA